jgi:hydrogenase maturation protein HypF
MIQRMQIHITGAVQGVGFRPFIYRLACFHRLSGTVANTSMGVEINVQGDEGEIARFVRNITAQKPERARIESIETRAMPLLNIDGFSIAHSQAQTETALALLPDTSICPQCMQEFSDPKNRRYRYPFIHCMSCGPRFSLFLAMPFDRGNTSMADFSMCSECRREYDDPEDRRFFSQTICCPACGPKLALFDNRRNKIASDMIAVDAAAASLCEGFIVAMKNTGGYLLMADASSEEAAQRLRRLKRRSRKPFALLAPDLASIQQIAHVSSQAQELLTSPAAPIVLLPKKSPGSIAPSVCFDSPYYGVMLPHQALHHLIMQRIGRPVIATSGNISDQPICITDEDAFEQLSGEADLFLTHNRRIIRRLDDSVVQIVRERPMVVRRARGYIPCAFTLPQNSECLFAAGGQMKNSFAIVKANQLYISQHIGDLDSCESCRAYDLEVKSFQDLLQTIPLRAVGDLHRDYYSAQYLCRTVTAVAGVQHHRAHILSCMVDQQILPPLLGIAWDGTGLGDDGTIWGAEAFLAQEQEMHRVATLFPFQLPGSEKAIREPRRSALGVLYALETPHVAPGFEPLEKEILIKALQTETNSPICSSMGRLFDAISSLVGLCQFNTFEGEAALALEAAALRATDGCDYEIPWTRNQDLWMMDWRLMVSRIVSDIERGVAAEKIALGFHNALAGSIVSLAQLVGMNRVVLTGGVMQNSLLLESAIDRLQSAGFVPVWHQNLPPNDGGLAAGQAMGALCV